jgi:putative pyoverdin transport system ATP-binding/permease protein
MKYFAFVLRHSRGTVILAILAGIISGACNTALLALVNESLRSEGRFLTALARAFAGLCVVVLGTRVLSQILLIHLSQKTIFDLRMQLGRRILAAPLLQLEAIGPPRLMASLADDIIAITNAIIFIPMICTNVAIVLACLIYLGMLSKTILLTVFIFVIVGIASYQLPFSLAMRYFRLARAEEDKVYKHFRAVTEGTKELKLHHNRREEFLAKVLDVTARAFRRHNTNGLSILSLATCWGQILVFILIGLLVFVVPTLNYIEPKTLTVAIIVILYLTGPLEAIVGIMPAFGQARVALNKVEELGFSLTSQASELTAMALSDTPPCWSRLELEGITHTYHREDENSNFALGPINMVLYPGEIVFLIGGNGSGKTTLAKLLTGLYVPESGAIRFDGAAVTDSNREAYRQHFSVVFADFYLFESLLGLGLPDLDDQARSYLARLKLNTKVQVQDGTLSTIDLSQGQRKRLALLTAYLEDRPIYIFDEWAADQDPLFKEVFYFEILPELKRRGKTAVVISHDDRYYHVADRIFKLDYGKLDAELPVAPRSTDAPKVTRSSV